MASRKSKTAGEDDLKRESRSTRGKRISTLEGEDEEKDKLFWGSEVWNEMESEDESFDEKDVDEEPDVFDSDFNESEDSESEGNEEEIHLKSTRKEEKRSDTNKYKEPVVAKRVRAVISSQLASDEQPLKRKKNKALQSRELQSNVNNLFSPSSNISISRSVRESTKIKTVDADINREKIKHSKSNKYRKQHPLIKHKFSQQELLKEAIETEIQNLKWVENQKKLATEDSTRQHLLDKGIKQGGSQGSFTRWVSRKGSYNIVTFSDVDSMPSFLVANSSSSSRNATTSIATLARITAAATTTTTTRVEIHA